MTSKIWLLAVPCAVGLLPIAHIAQARQTTPAAPPQTAPVAPSVSAAEKRPAAPAAVKTPIIEPRAMALLKKSQQAMFALRTYRAECRTTLTREKPREKQSKRRYEVAFLTAAKPNKMRYDAWTLKNAPQNGSNSGPAAISWKKPASVPTFTFACDGRRHFRQYGSMYRKEERTAPEYLNTILEPWGGFYTRGSSAYASAIDYQKKHELLEARLAGRENVAGVPCDKVFVSVSSSYEGSKYENRATWYIGPDGLVRRCVDYVSFDAKPGNTRDAVLTDIRVNAPVSASRYAYAPPPGVKLEAEEKQAPLLANGTTAPDFTAQDMDKKPVKLSDLRGKVVVIDFWASWCPPCNAAMPHNQAVMQKLQAEGLPVVMLAVDDGEGREAFEAWVKAKQASLSALTFVYALQKENVSGKQFKVTGIPTQYVLDKNGVICASSVGFDKANDDLEKSIRAALADKTVPADAKASPAQANAGK